MCDILIIEGVRNMVKLGSKRATNILLERIAKLKLSSKLSDSEKKTTKHYLRWIAHRLESNPQGFELIE